MKILIITHEFPPVGGGGANACLHLAGEYIKAGHDVSVVTVDYPGVGADLPFPAASPNGGALRFIKVNSKRKRKSSCGFPEMLDFMLKASGAAKALVSEAVKAGEPFDVCQIFFAIPAGPVGWLLKRKFGLPYIIRFGGGDIPGFQERFKLLYKLIGPFERPVWDEAFALVANSAGLRELAAAFHNKKEILVIPNGVDMMGTGDTAQAGENPAPLQILFVSRLIERKGLQHFIPQLRALRESIARGVRLTVVGDGPYGDELKRLCKECGVEDIVSFEGQRDKRELPAYYSSGDVFILPSKKEGMPNVVLEAMAAGLPIVMTPCQGSDELIDGNGFAVPAESFGEKLNYLCTHSDEMKRMGARSRELAEERFTWSATAGAYMDLFRRAGT